MKYLFLTVAFLFIHSGAYAQSSPTILEPLKVIGEGSADVIANPNPIQGPTVEQQGPGQQQQGPGQGPGQQQGPGQGPGQKPPHPPHSGGKGGGKGGSPDEYDGGSAEFEQVYYTPAYVSKMIAENMRIQCYHGLCEMAMVDTRGSAFVVETNAGYGQQNGMGGLGGTGGTVVVNPTGYNVAPQPYLGVSIRYVHQNCKQSIRVPTSLYVSMNTYLYSLINEDGTTKRTFDPAEQTMILFYTTVMKQATGCTTPTR